ALPSVHRPRCRLVPCHLHLFGDARAPSAFPTRRSSDLKRQQQPAEQRPQPARDAWHDRERERPDQPRCQLDLHVKRIELASGLIDRKSTRLNSSHVKISYAVFCLKKKNATAKLAAPRPS